MIYINGRVDIMVFIFLSCWEYLNEMRQFSGWDIFLRYFIVIVKYCDL